MGVGREKEKEKREKKKILPQHLFVTVAFCTGDREAVGRSCWAGGGGVVVGEGPGEPVSPREGSGLQDAPRKMASLSFHCPQSYKGWEVAVGSCLSGVLQSTFSEYNKAETAQLKEEKTRLRVVHCT